VSTLLCIPILAADVDAGLRDASQARAAGADLVEFRIDEMFSGSGDAAEERAVLRLVAESPLPCIVTCRPTWEGGHYDGDEAARIALMERLGTAFGPGEHPPRFIDVELAAFERSANLRQKVKLAVDHPEQIRDLKTSLILSSHDFAGRPTDLSRRILKMRSEPAAAIHKVAFRARSLRDNLELFDMLAARERPTIALGMGEFGLMSRVLAPKFGAFLTFASLRDSSVTAPGQPRIGDLVDLYRFRSIGPRTKVYGVVGWPVAHSLSPHVHNAGFGAIGFDGVYLPLPIAGAEGGSDASYESLKATLGELVDHQRLDLCGCSITIPHKENVLRLGRELGWEIDPLAGVIGAANTLAVERSPSGKALAVRLSNTDAAAARDSLASAIGSLRGVRVAVLGAGGAARAVAVGMVEAGASVIIASRRAERAASMSAELAEAMGAGDRLGSAGLDELPGRGCEVYINCTPVGMSGGPDPEGLPIPASHLRAGCRAVMDTVYAPRETPLLREARRAGCIAVDGLGMFVRQAEAQFRTWTGREAPPGVLAAAAERELAARAPSGRPE
jgi:3-dehydroquinate dehydratase/shikimate dehydrogenase